MKVEVFCGRCGRSITHPSVDCREREGRARYVVVRHDLYGCDSGCCGHRIVAYDEGGRQVGSVFSFSHPSSDVLLGGHVDDPETWARDEAAAFFPHVDVYWGGCEVLDD